MADNSKRGVRCSRWLAGVSSVLALAACEILPGQTSAPSGFPPEALGPIETEEQLRAHVVDRNLYFGDDIVIITSAGRLDGNVSGEPLSGTWFWDERFWCRTVTSEQEMALTDCQVFEATAEGLQVTSRRGEGTSFLYTLSPVVAEAAADAASTEAVADAGDVIATEEIEAVPLEPVEGADAAAQ